MMESVNKKKTESEGTCGKKTQVYSRVVGYIRPVCNWNDAKQEEFVDRKTYGIDNGSTDKSN